MITHEQIESSAARATAAVNAWTEVNNNIMNTCHAVIHETVRMKTLMEKINV